jgi:membrane fusion protein, macrolide-specific efflux system
MDAREPAPGGGRPAQGVPMESIQEGEGLQPGIPRLHDTQETEVVNPVPPPPQTAPAGRGGSRRRRAVAVVAVAVVLAGAGIGTWLATRGGGAPRSTSGFVVVTRTVRVTSGTMSQSVSASGTIQPAQTANLNFAVSGRVTKVDVAVGDMVKTGETVATIAPTALEAQEAAAQQTLTADEAKLAADEASKAGTSQVAADEATVTSAQTQLTTAKKSVADATLVSTITGEVSNVDLTVGEQVSGSGVGGSSSSPTKVYGPGAGTSSSNSQVTIVSPDRFIVDCTVDDIEVGELSDGDRVLVAQTGTAVSAPGTVTFVGLVPSGTGIPSYPVTVTLTGTPTDIYAGTNAQLTMIVKSLSHVLEVPTPAVSYRQGQASVEVKLPGGGHALQPVTVGTTLNGETEITKGVRAGQLVVERIETFRGKPTKGRGSGKFPSPIIRRVTTGGTGFVGSGPIQVPGG